MNRAYSQAPIQLSQKSGLCVIRSTKVDCAGDVAVGSQGRRAMGVIVSDFLTAFRPRITVPIVIHIDLLAHLTQHCVSCVYIKRLC